MGLISDMYFSSAVRGPFTPSQWLELEHQALIYKYIIANVPIPPNLLIPIRKAIETAAFYSFTGGPLGPNTLGWGPFHLGLANSTDPEPGRCRRTDGKKWRCTRDAVTDQKYCERHMNRGRHRSRKHVEGQIGHSVAGATSTTSTTKLMPVSSSSPALVVTGVGMPNTPNNFSTSHHQVKNWQFGASNSAASTLNNRMLVDKEGNNQGMQDNTQLSFLSSNLNLNSAENSSSVAKQRMPDEESAPSKFGVPSSNPLINTSLKGSSLCRNYASSQDLNDRVQHSLRPFMDAWPIMQADQSGILWPELPAQSERTELSISIPMAPLDFMSSTSSPTNEKVMVSPPRFSQERNPIKMDLGMGTVLNVSNHRQAIWNPMSWENSLGGPLGEVLHSTSSCSRDSKKASALNLLSKGWEGSLQLSSSSPTHVLQATTFGSLSNCSTGSSPRVENIKKFEAVSLCDNLIGSSVLSSTLPVL
ncbi:hypothetical protein Ancab_016596 [Ancistrocladus abbreviatus]